MAFAKKEDAFAYVNKYQQENYDRITVMASKGKKEIYRKAAEERGMKLSAFMQYCADKEIEK